VDTVNHVVHLYWYGTDADGYVRSYQVKLVNPADTAAADSAWRGTLRTDSLITVMAPTGYTKVRFEVAAVDDHGVVDPTPAVQRFQFSNIPPVVTLTQKPLHSDRSDTTFASVTVGWTVTDRDGDASKVVTRIWLDRMPGDPIVATGNTLTVPSDRFKIGGVYTSGRRTLYIQGTDDGGMAGPIDSVTWYVRQPVLGTRARVLVIDEQPLTDPLSIRTRNDTLFTNAVKRFIPADQMAFIWLSATQPIKSVEDMRQTLALFESVVWFRGAQPSTSTFSSVLLRYRDGVGQYLDSGGKLYLETQNMVQGLSSQGALSQAFASRYLNIDGVFQYRSPPDSSALYAANTGTKLYCPTFGDTLAKGDSLSALATMPNMRAFRTRDASQIYIYAKAGALSPANAIPMPVALNVPQSRGGRLVANTFPLFYASRSSAIATNIMRQIGLDQP
jgi:hypothetical protein